MADLSITAALLSRAAKRNGYAVPNKGLVFFGIRGLAAESPFSNGFAQSQSGNFADIDYKRMRCTLGQWKVETGEIALFPGSTVPSLPNIANARAKGGTGTNLLMFGRYEHERGMHKLGKRSGHRAFRQAIFFPVWRTADNTDFDLKDKLDFGSSPGDFVFDNIHCAYDENPEHGYSSAGCQVVCGAPMSPARNNAPETGPWKTFIDNGYAGSQKRFVYLLFGAEELSSVDKGGGALKQVVRYGSSGPLARQVQDALISRGLLEGSSDGEFGRLSLMALVAFQRKEFGSAAADGVCGENTAAVLGIALPPLSTAPDAPVPKHSTEVATGANVELEDETDLPPDTLKLLLAALGIDMPAVGPAAPAAAPVAVAPVPAAAADAPEGKLRNFERAQEIIREFEGGFVNDPKDPGGATNFGITKKTLEAWRKRPVTVAEVAAMTYDEAKQIYFAEYWSKSSCDAMPGPLALPVYNVTVHAGPDTAARFLQLALNQNGAAVEVDGGIGGETLGAIPKVPLAELISDYIDLYEAKLRAHKNFAHFKTGFLRRVNKLRLESDKWLAEQGTTITAIPTPKIEDGEAPVTPQTNELIEILIRTLGGASSGQPQTPVATPAPDAPTPTAPQAANLADMLRDLAERLSPSTDTVRPDSAAGGVVTPVNGALGQTIGKALDGKKSALGIIGALASALFMPTAAVTAGAAAPDLSSPLGAILPAVIGGAGQSVAPFLMPISLALTAWGVFGKVDKYFRSKK